MKQAFKKRFTVPLLFLAFVAIISTLFTWYDFQARQSVRRATGFGHAAEHIARLNRLKDPCRFSIRGFLKGSTNACPTFGC